MSNYERLWDLYCEAHDIDHRYRARLKRLICGYHGTQLFFSHLIRPGDHVADVGCYFGQWSYPLLENAARVCFIDYTGEKFPYLDRLSGGNPKARFLVHDFTEELLSGEQNFDVILCMYTLEYVDRAKLERFCKNMVLSLKDGGYLFIDMRDPERLAIWMKFILNLDGLVRLFYPHLVQERLLLGEKFRIVKSYIYERIRRNLSHLARSYLSPERLSVLKKILHGQQYAASNQPYPKDLDHIFRKCGLSRLSLGDFIDVEIYEMLRGIEGYNLFNTFVGNYSWVSLYRKE